MGPHKTPPLEERLDRVESDISTMKQSLRNHPKQFSFVRQEFKRIDKRFDRQEKILITWKNQLFRKIDKFMERIDNQDKEIATIAFRKEDHEERLSKLEKSGKFLAA